MRILSLLTLCLLTFTASSALAAPAAEDFSTWARDHRMSTPIWVLPKATAPSNMEWTVPDMPGSHRADAFYDTATCAGCHGMIYDQWKGSMMASAWSDPVFRAVYFKYVREAKD